jgi:hypothetical protein
VFRKVILNVIFFCLALLITMAGYRIGAGENGNNRTPGKVTQSDDNAVKSNHTRWFADPVRGWIRNEERSEPPKKQRGAQDAQDKSGSSGRQGPARVLWEY